MPCADVCTNKEIENTAFYLKQAHWPSGSIFLAAPFLTHYSVIAVEFIKFSDELNHSPTLANHSEPLGLCYIGASAKKQGHNVRIIHQITESNDKILRMAEEYKPDVVGFSALTYNFNNAVELSGSIKHSLGAKTVFGGVHVIADPDAIHNNEIDYLIRGEGDIAFSELVFALENKADASQLEQIKGIVYKNGNRIINTGLPDRIKNLDELLFPLRENLPVGEKYYVRQGLTYPAPSQQRRASINSSRGCMYKCTFCTSPLQWQGNWIGRSSENIVDEIEQLVKDYKINYLEFKDENFTQDKNRVIAICKEFDKREVKLNWYCQGRISDLINGNGEVDIEILNVIKNAGCFEIEYGIESGLNNSLRKMHKGITAEQTMKVVEASKKAGLSVHALMMLGFPWEQRPDLEASVEFAKNLVADRYRFSFCVPFAGTSMSKEVDFSKLKELNEDKWTTDFPVVELNDMTLEELMLFRQEAYRQVYLNDAYSARVKERIKQQPELRPSYVEWFEFLNQVNRINLESIIEF